MTLVMAFRITGEDSGDAIIVTADSRVSGGSTVFETEKITPIAFKDEERTIHYLALVTGSGDGAIVKQLTRIVEIELRKLCAEFWKNTPSFDEFEEAMNQVQYEFWKKLQAFREKAGLTPRFQLLICSVDISGVASMYLFDETGTYNPVHKTPGFACLGRGVDTGGLMIVKQFMPKKLTRTSALMLSAYAINMVSELDTSVGKFTGSSYHFGLKDGKPVISSFIQDKLDEPIERVVTRVSAMKKTWQLCDLFGESEVLIRLFDISKALSEAAKE
jgi:hypothetical protein